MLFRSSAQILCIVLPTIPLESFQVSVTVTEMGVLAFRHRVEQSFAIVASYISRLFIFEE